MVTRRSSDDKIVVALKAWRRRCSRAIIAAGPDFNVDKPLVQGLTNILRPIQHNSCGRDGQTHNASCQDNPVNCHRAIFAS